MTTNPHPTLQRIGLSLLAHFDLESRALEQLSSAMEELRQALLEAALPRVEAARARQAVVTEQLTALRSARAGHVQAAAAALRIAPADFQVRKLAARLPGGLARQLDTARERLRALAVTTDAQARRNATLASHCLAYVRERLDELSTEVAIGRYSAEGKTIEPPRTSIIVVQG